MSHPARGPARSVGIDGKANASSGRPTGVALTQSDTEAGA